MLQRGYYPSTDERLRGTFLLSPVQDLLPLYLGADAFIASVRGRIHENSVDVPVFLPFVVIDLPTHGGDRPPHRRHLLVAMGVGIRYVFGMET